MYGMVVTLHKYIFRELLRVFIFAAIGLTLILSLGSILQPVHKYGVGPRQVVHLMVFFLPITLTFVLPMAALFAGALIYGRFASDNELDACRASGISLVTLTFPGLVLAILVAAANLFLSFYVMPIFVHRAEKSLKADAKQIVFRNIERRRYYMLPPDRKYLIYADQVDWENDLLLGVVVAEMEDNEMKDVITTEAAKVIIKRHDTYNEVQITAYEASTLGPLGKGDAETMSFRHEFGSLLGDEIKFKKLDEMTTIAADMTQFYPIERLARQIFIQLNLEILAQDIQSWIDKTKGRTLHDSTETENGHYELPGMPKSVKLTADRCSLQKGMIELSGEIEVVEYDRTTRRPLSTLTCAMASLHIEENMSAPTLILDLQSPRQMETGELKLRYPIHDLVLPQAVQRIANQFRTRSGSLKLETLVTELSTLSGLQPSSKLLALQGQLDRLIRRTSVEIKSEMHTRLVFGAGCIPMILIGIGLGVLKKGGHLLSAFGASCVPAAMLIVCIMSGKQLTENLDAQTVSGIALMWAGLGILSMLVVVIYGWLLRH